MRGLVLQMRLHCDASLAVAGPHAVCRLRRVGTHIAGLAIVSQHSARQLGKNLP